MTFGSEALVASYDGAMAVSAKPGSVIARPAGGYLSARLPVADLALGAVGAVAWSTNRLLDAAGSAPRAWHLDPERIAGSFGGEKALRIGGIQPHAFAPLSGFFRTRDGWVRTHANYPHHRRRLVALLGFDPDRDVDTDSFADAIRHRSAADIEDEAVRAGALVVRVTTEEEWRLSAVGGTALVDYAVYDGGGKSLEVGWDVGHPLAGVRVLDMTRVLAGPIAARNLALLGAEVLRVDPPFLPEIESQHLVTGSGKRTALLDLRTHSNRQVFDALLAEADVLLTGYRPGAFERLGIDDRRPGLIHGRIHAWEHRGSRAGRRGFDSLVQAATGISWIEGGNQPGVLPVQALDHASGHLLAAAVVDALTGRMATGDGASVGVVLERTARWLLDIGNRVADAPPPVEPGPRTIVVRDGLTTDRPALAEYDDYPFPARPWGRDAAAWQQPVP